LWNIRPADPLKASAVDGAAALEAVLAVLDSVICAVVDWVIISVVVTVMLSVVVSVMLPVPAFVR
jgi:hypothetical protein